MEKFTRITMDPIQEKFTEKLTKQGVNFSQNKENRLLTAAEWFERQLQKNGINSLPTAIDQIPETIKTRDSVEELQKLINFYNEKRPSSPVQEKQTELDFPA